MKLILNDLKKLGNYEMRLTEDKIQEIMANLIEVELKPGVELRHVANALKFVGIVSRKRNILNQTAYILKKRGRYFICHFKQLMALDGKPVNYTEDDGARVHWIAKTLEHTTDLYSIVGGYDDTIDFDDYELNVTRLVTQPEPNTFTDSITLRPMYHFD